jgi:hypothetical protein
MPESLYRPPKFRVGNAVNPKSSDPWYDDELKAIEEAQSYAKLDFHRPIAVWDEQDNILHLFLCGEQFRSV